MEIEEGSAMARYTFVVLTDPVEGRDDDYNEWYDTRHLADVLAVDGFVAAQRFKLTDTDPAQEFSHRYLALYEVETDNIEKTQLALAQAAQSDAMPISDALAASASVARFFTPITDRVTAEASPPE